MFLLNIFYYLILIVIYYKYSFTGVYFITCCLKNVAEFCISSDVYRWNKKGLIHLNLFVDFTNRIEWL